MSTLKDRLKQQQDQQQQDANAAGAQTLYKRWEKKVLEGSGSAEFSELRDYYDAEAAAIKLFDDEGFVATVTEGGRGHRRVKIVSK